MTLHRECGIIVHIPVVGPRDPFRTSVVLLDGGAGGHVQGAAHHVAADRPPGGAVPVGALKKDIFLALHLDKVPNLMLNPTCSENVRGLFITVLYAFTV